MKIHRGDVALITGASRGLGRHIALELAGRGMNVVLAARSQDGLDAVAAEVRADTGVAVSTVEVDLADRAQAASLASRAVELGGRVDVLVNNAGVGEAAAHEVADLDDLGVITDVNLLAPMVLTSSVLPGMIERRRGHIVNVSSVAGLMATAYMEPYTATKFGVVGYTRALRLTARDQGWNVSASVLCPGFMAAEDGLYTNMKREFGVSAPKAAGEVPIEALGRAVVKAIEKDLPDVIVARGGSRAIAAASIAMPRLMERFALKADLAAPFRVVAERHRAQR
ncbi:SDR family NAD(P)-dependent oxidoreductase [Mycobacterium sp. NPDC003449]